MNGVDISMASVKNQIERLIKSLTEYMTELKRDPIIPQKVFFSVNKRYYYRNDKTKKGGRSYIGKRDSKKLKELIKSSYKYRLLDALSRNIRSLKKALDDLPPLDSDHIIGSMSPCIRGIPFQYPFDTSLGKLIKWANSDYERNPLPYPDRIILAKDGTRVRSKSECIIYNALLDAGIPFRYDPLIELYTITAEGQRVTVRKSPDFQIMLPDGSFILIEHAGLLISKKYVFDLAEKIQTYLLNGFVLGYSLFVTGDTIDGGIDSKQIEDIIGLIASKFVEF